MIRRPPRSTQGVSSAASDVYKRQVSTQSTWGMEEEKGYSYHEGGIRHPDSIAIDPLKEGRPIKSITRVTGYWGEDGIVGLEVDYNNACLLYTSPSPRDLSTSRMPSSA
eukprot:TRINITY_DN31934_c0_g1_i1.p2 TRINITY_DN31934_c0_g1~~TRINITY_DN31934_c0_g1_i1.p2  ORF type:complete len:109 (-),score=37.71 TRINITY_DN31934_c0_g1_i1:78-404(-)